MNCLTWVLAALMLVGAALAFYVAWRIHALDRKVKDERERVEKERRRKISER